MKPVITVNDVSKQYQLGATRTSLLSHISSSITKFTKAKYNASLDSSEFWALKEITFEVYAGQSLGLIGKNGAGKSTLLKLLAGITLPTSGTIDVVGRLSALIELGSGFHPDLSGRENIYLNGTILGLSRKEISKRFDEIVEFAEIERFIDTPVKRYSSGMLVRLGFSVASCIEPEILLVDEVLAVGDASFRQKCLQRINTLLNNGTTILFVSHNLYMMRAVCPDSLYIVKGHIKYSGNTIDAIDNYEHDLHEEQAKKMEKVSPSDQIIRDIVIEKVEIIDPRRNNTPDEFDSNKRARVNIIYSSSQNDFLANAVIRLVRTDGVTCCMMRTSIDLNTTLLLRRQGVISVILNPLQLAGGTYYVEAHILNKSDSIVLSSSYSNWFYVSGTAMSHEEQSGIFEPYRIWQSENTEHNEATEPSKTVSGYDQ